MLSHVSLPSFEFSWLPIGSLAVIGNKSIKGSWDSVKWAGKNLKIAVHMCVGWNFYNVHFFKLKQIKITLSKYIIRYDYLHYLTVLFITPLMYSGYEIDTTFDFACIFVFPNPKFPRSKKCEKLEVVYQIYKDKLSDKINRRKDFCFIF